MSYPPPTLTLPPLGRGDLNRLIDFWNGYNTAQAKKLHTERVDFSMDGDYTVKSKVN